MKKNTIPQDYANNLIYDLQKAFWDERGKGARFRTTTVGREYFLEKCLDLIQSSDVDHIIQTICEVIQDENIAVSASFSIDDRLLQIQVEGCIHLQVEKKLIEHGVEPFTCVPANLIVLAIEEKLDRPVELAEVKIEDAVCNIQLVLFDERPSL
ncbi:MAG: hypothetical protein E3J69_07375 [Anaerolineales bacterium]|nr:MAG: hypothetical protein E3J69_07375 [Anaerolineales bacterium]